MWHKVDSEHALKVELRRFSIELDTVRRLRDDSKPSGLRNCKNGVNNE